MITSSAIFLESPSNCSSSAAGDDFFKAYIRSLGHACLLDFVQYLHMVSSYCLCFMIILLLFCMWNFFSRSARANVTCLRSVLTLSYLPPEYSFVLILV